MQSLNRDDIASELRALARKIQEQTPRGVIRVMSVTMELDVAHSDGRRIIYTKTDRPYSENHHHVNVMKMYDALNSQAHAEER